MIRIVALSLGVFALILSSSQSVLAQEESAGISTADLLTAVDATCECSSEGDGEEAAPAGEGEEGEETQSPGKCVRWLSKVAKAWKVLDFFGLADGDDDIKALMKSKKKECKSAKKEKGKGSNNGKKPV